MLLLTSEVWDGCCEVCFKANEGRNTDKFGSGFSGCDKKYSLLHVHML
jgi:hypothetical protein